MNQITISGLVQKIEEAKKNMVGNCLIIGKCLAEIAENELWKQYGEHLETFDDFLKEIVIAKSTGHHYMNVWKRFGEYLTTNGLAIPVRRLIKLLPIATEENKEELLHKAEILSDSDFNKEIAEEKGIIDCQCPEEFRRYYYQCTRCKSWHLIDKPNEKE